MSNKHKNPTISFRISDAERKQIEARILASGMLKKDYFVRSCIYNRICVVGKKETIYPVVEALQELQHRTAAMQEAFLSYASDNSGDANTPYTLGAAAKSDDNTEQSASLPTLEDITALQEDYANLLNAVINLLDGARYLWEGGHCINE